MRQRLNEEISYDILEYEIFLLNQPICNLIFDISKIKYYLNIKIKNFNINEFILFY